LLDHDSTQISLTRQCELLNLSRSTAYYTLASETLENLSLMHLIDKQYTETPFFGSRKMAAILTQGGSLVNRKRVQRLMRVMGLEAIYAKPRTSIPNIAHRKYPYLLRGLDITRPNQVWSTDITFLPLRNGFMYLVAVMDWYSRYVLTWELSNSLHGTFCEHALNAALELDLPEIFNTDQGSQFTAESFTSILAGRNIQISMDGRGRALDNVFIERLWRSLKYEDLYIRDYSNGSDLYYGLQIYFELYNKRRPHQALGYRTPEMLYFGLKN
jgi:putative transposase